MKFYRVSGRKDCDHDSLTYLGADGGNNEYFYCSDCGAAIIKEEKSDFRREKREIEKGQKKSLIDKIFRR